jgi:hypothetical protein
MISLLQKLIPTTVLAQALDTYYEPAKALNNSVGGAGNLSLATFISPILQNFNILIGVTSLLAMIFAGVNFIQSGADTKKAQQAQNMITYSVIGLVLSIAAFWITRLLFSVFAGGIF